MEAALIKKGAIMECASVAVTTAGILRSKDIIVPGNRIKIITRGEVFQCLVLPVDESNGPTYVWLYPSQIRPAREYKQA